MPFNGAGIFNVVNTYVPNTTILSAAVNQNFTDIATGLSDCLTRDGQAGMTAALKAISGTLGAPGIAFNSDASSGLYLSASGVPGFVAHSLGMLLNTTIYSATSATVQAGGTGYAVGDTIVQAGGTSPASLPTVYTVATLSGSAVATVTVAFPGFYSVKASNPVSQASTSGVGSGCTLNVTYNDPTSSDYRAFFSDQSGGVLWQKFGASSFVSGLMNSANALTFAQGIGSSALVQVIGGTLLIPPQGVLTPIGSTTSPIPASDQTAQTRFYWTPLNGDVIPIYNGSQLVLKTSGQIACDLTAGAQAAGGIYDVYAFLNGSSVVLGLSPSWSAGTGGSVTSGSCARGTGAGGTDLTPIRGINTNSVAMTVNNGSATFSVAASQGTYLGSVYVNSTAGQFNCYLSYGQGRVWGLWNAYNRRQLILQAGDATSSWAYSTAVARPSNNNTANSISVFTGLPLDRISTQFTQSVTGGATSLASQVIAKWRYGIGWNATNTISGQSATPGARIDGSSLDILLDATSTANYVAAPSLGINVATSLELGVSLNNANITWNGTQSNMLLTAAYLG